MFDAPVAVVNLALEGDLAIRRDHAFVLPFLTGKEPVAWAEIEGNPVGCQVWSVKQEGRVWYYEVSYVLPEFRGRGVLAAVRGLVRKRAREDGKVKFIEYLISCDNADMIRSVERAGMKPSNFHYRYQVKASD